MFENQTKTCLRLISLQRSFNSKDNVRPRELFKYQISLISAAYNENSVILSNFKLRLNQAMPSDNTIKMWMSLKK